MAAQFQNRLNLEHNLGYDLHQHRSRPDRQPWLVHLDQFSNMVKLINICEALQFQHIILKLGLEIIIIMSIKKTQKTKEC